MVRKFLVACAVAAALPGAAALAQTSPGAAASMAEINAQRWSSAPVRDFQLDSNIQDVERRKADREAQEWMRTATPEWKARATKVMELVNAGQCKTAVQYALSQGDRDMAERALGFCRKGAEAAH